MGFVRANIIPILNEHKRLPFSGKLLLFGQADVYFDLATLDRMADVEGVALCESIAPTLSHAKVFADKHYISGETLFRKMGFNHISVLDYTDFEGADIVYDLNRDDLPNELCGQFDVVIDHGTLEHVFHLPNALNNIFRLLKCGGRAITSSPSGNFFDHGFYMFQPTLFLDYYSTNLWQINNIWIAQFTPEQETEPAFFARYEPGMFAPVSYGKMDNKLYSTICVATKNEKSTGLLIPQQGIYSRMKGWSNSACSERSTPLRTFRALLQKIILKK
jgi:SAM-dependent methyltransferase